MDITYAKELLDKAMTIYRESAPIPQSEIDKYKGGVIFKPAL